MSRLIRNRTGRGVAGLAGIPEVTKMRWSLLLESLLLVSGIIVAGGPASAQTQQPPPSISPAMPVTTPATDPSKMAEPAGTKPATPAIDVDTFVLGTDDQISISMWDEPKYNGNYTIRPDGKINMPLIGEIQAAGMTPLQLQEAINKAALTQLRTPRCTVNVLAVHSKRIYFDGEGIATGARDLTIPIHLLEAISAQGGFRDFADKKHIKILRDGKLYMTINYNDLISGKHPEKNILLQDKDHVIVP
jgi:polysaccharide export outer membrane protein